MDIHFKWKTLIIIVCTIVLFHNYEYNDIKTYILFYVINSSVRNRVLRGKVFGTPTPYCPVIFFPDPDRTEK